MVSLPLPAWISGARTRSGFVACCLVASATAVQGQVSIIATAAPVLSPVAAWNPKAEHARSTALANSLSVMINSGATQTLTSLVNNRTNTFPTPVNITTQWQLSTLLSTVDLVAYFATPSAALTSGANSLPSSRLNGRMVSGGVPEFRPFSQQPVVGAGTPGGTLHLFRQTIIALVNGQGSRTDDLELQLDLRGVPRLASGTYRGTLTLRAVAY